jgi:hypothetical protein
MNNLTNHEPEETNKQITQQELLWKILNSVERIDTTLIGSAYTNYKGLVHRVEEHGTILKTIDERVNKLEFSSVSEEKVSKKSNSFLATVASWVAIIIAALALIFSSKK